MRSASLPGPAEVTDDTMLPLKMAAELAQAHGVLAAASAKSLRREADRGRLEIWLPFGRQHTTLGAIKRMIKRCHVQPRAPASTTGERTTGGSSKMPEESSSALAALMESTRRLRDNSKRTSRRSTSPTSGQVIPLASRSSTS
jgi:hypothetical protein